MSDVDKTLATIDDALADNDLHHRQEQAIATARALTEGLDAWKQAIVDMWNEVAPALIAAAEAIREAQRETARQWPRPPRAINPHGHRANATGRHRRRGGRR